MKLIDGSVWSLGVVSHSFNERLVLDVLGNSLARVYGQPEQEPLPDRLQELVARLAEREQDSSRGEES